MKLLINYGNRLFRDSQKLNSKTGLDTAGFEYPDRAKMIYLRYADQKICVTRSISMKLEAINTKICSTIGCQQSDH